MIRDQRTQKDRPFPFKDPGKGRAPAIPRGAFGPAIPGNAPSKRILERQQRQAAHQLHIGSQRTRSHAGWKGIQCDKDSTMR